MQGLDPRVRIRWVLSALLSVLVLGAVLVGLGAVVFDVSPWIGIGVAAAVLPLTVGYVVARYRNWRYGLETDALSLERGVLTKVDTAVPYVRIQHVDTRRGPLDRLFGLGSVVVYTAGSRGADVEIPGLAREDARALRNRLRDLAIESEPEDAV